MHLELFARLKRRVAFESRLVGSPVGVLQRNADFHPSTIGTGRRQPERVGVSWPEVIGSGRVVKYDNAAVNN
jgi:hypothetical protein